MASNNLTRYMNEPVMESFYDMRNAQEPKDRLHYFDVVMEGSVESNAILLQKLYTDIISRSNIDFGSIPDSQGALIKYKEYKLMAQSMEQLNLLYEGTPSEDLTIMNKLHDMIIACRKDYELGYKFDIEILKISYCTAVMTLFEMINVCILLYTRSLRDAKGIDFDFKKVKKKDVLVIRGAKSLVKSYETGQWNTLMNEFKKDPMKYSNSIATEAGIFSDDAKKFIANAANKLGMFGPDGAPAKLDLKEAFKHIPLPLKVIGIAIAAFMTIRTLIFVFFNSAVKLKDWLRVQKDFIEATTRTEMNDGNVSQNVIEKRTKLAQKLEGIANFIEVRILKTDTDAKKDMMSTNKENYNKSEFTNTANAFGGSIEF
jgi:hypothetical protein